MRRMELPQHFEQLSLAGCDYRRWSRPGQRQLSVQPRALPGVLPGSPVRPVQPDGVEAVSYALDLTAEIRRVETAFALRARRRVRGGYDRRSLREQGLEHLLYDEGVARVIQFELVEAEQAKASEVGSGLADPAHPDLMDELLERQVRLRFHFSSVERRGQQVGLADPEATVEVQSPTFVRPALKEAEQPPPGRLLPQTGCKLLQLLQRQCLRRMRRPVACDISVQEPGWRAQVRLCGTVGPAEHAQLADFCCSGHVPKPNTGVGPWVLGCLKRC